MTTHVAPTHSSGSLLSRLIDAPALVHTVRALPGPAFAALVRHVGLEDAGELVALATTEQLVAAFDEDLFSNVRPGERETLDPARFATWLEVLLEAGEAVAAARVAALSEDFVAHALSGLMVVLDHEALLARMGEGDDNARAADKAIESCHCEELDGYLLVSRDHDGWDAALALILALDRDHRDTLVRVLDRCASASARYVDDLDALTEVLSAGDSLADDVEGDREDRRARLGHVDPRSARSFLTLAKRPSTVGAAVRDPVTRRYFRELERHTPAVAHRAPPKANTPALLSAIAAVVSGPAAGLAGPVGHEDGPARPLVEAMQLLADLDVDAFHQRMTELAYLDNVLLAGFDSPNGRLRPMDAAEAVLATVSFGAALAADPPATITPSALRDVLRHATADGLFRLASRALTLQGVVSGLLRNEGELAAALRAAPLVGTGPATHP